VEAGVQLAAALGAGQVLEGVCRVIAEQVVPGHIRHSAVTPVLEFGACAGVTLDAAVATTADRVAQAVRAAGMHAVRPADMAIALWEKFLFIEPMGSVGAAARRPYGVVRTVPETRTALDAALDEVLAVGRASGVAWPADAKAKVWKRYDGLPAGEYTSMARDLIAGRAGEFEAQTGAVVRLARAHGVPTPVHDVLYAVLRPTALDAP
jgi:2-dehydropantoate 2-reductase